MKIILDFGQRTAYNFWGDLTSKLTFVDKKGKTIEFNSMIDAANYMRERHWYFLQAYVTYPKNELMEHWLFYKDAASPEKAKEGIMTKEDFRKSYPRKEGKDESKPIEEEGNEQENE